MKNRLHQIRLYGLTPRAIVMLYGVSLSWARRLERAAWANRIMRQEVSS